MSLEKGTLIELESNVRKSERLDYQVRKRQLDSEFLNACLKYNAILNFLRFRVINKTLKDLLTYSRCQQLLLSEEIRCKKRHLSQLLEYDRIKQELQYLPLILCMCHHCFLYQIIK